MQQRLGLGDRGWEWVTEAGNMRQRLGMGKRAGVAEAYHQGEGIGMGNSG